MMPERSSEITRTTRETDISLSLCLDGGEVDINTGIGFFDHMLNSFAVHGGFGMTVSVTGDLQVDGHHTVEDTGIVLGMAFAKALGDKSGIERFGSFFVPMDEALSFCAVDISGRPFLIFDSPLESGVCGTFDACLTKEFFRALAFNAGITLHLKTIYGDNTHHIVESLFKASAHALCTAVKPRDGGVLSTKGSL